MKRNRIVVLLLASFSLLVSCHFFTGKQTASYNPLLGSWKIDSIAGGRDSSSLKALLLALAVKDSAVYDYHFEQDSISFFGKGETPQKVSYAYIDSTKQLVIMDAETEVYVVRPLSDSTTGLVDRDSSIIFLKKK